MTIKIDDITSKEILSTREAAVLLKVTTQTVKNYIYSGRLKALRTPGGHHRIRRVDLKGLGFVAEEEKGTQNFLPEDIWAGDYYNLLNTFISTVETIMRAIDTRDIVASGHSLRVADLAHAVGKKMGLVKKELQELKLAALFHDVGKIGISESILGKPGRLTEQEYSLVKKHPEIGERIVSEIEQLRPIVSSIRHHHERFDGRGYPDGIGGSDIELYAQIIAVAETYDFLRSDFPFRKAFSKDDALQEIKNSSGTQFNPEVVNNFVDVIEGSSLQYH